MREVWRRIDTWDAEPGFNMALDEALLAADEARPTLRFYTWRPAALSLGYFQRFDEVPPAREAAAVVRRLTGGGAIHHDDELTFSISAPLDHALYAGPVPLSYARVHGVLARGLAPLGVVARMRGEGALASDREGTGMCFHQSTPLDLAWSQAKGVGTAQRRRGGRVLHHGSIKLGVGPWEAGSAGLRQARPDVEPRELADLLRTAFQEELGVELGAAEPSQAELDHARRRSAHFTSEAFVRRR